MIIINTQEFTVVNYPSLVVEKCCVLWRDMGPLEAILVLIWSKKWTEKCIKNRGLRKFYISEGPENMMSGCRETASGHFLQLECITLFKSKLSPGVLFSF